MVSNHIIIGANRGGNVKCGQDVTAASPCNSHCYQSQMTSANFASRFLASSAASRPEAREWLTSQYATDLDVVDIGNLPPCTALQFSDSPILMHLTTPLLLSAWQQCFDKGHRVQIRPASLGIHTCQGFLSFSCLARKICLDQICMIQTRQAYRSSSPSGGLLTWVVLKRWSRRKSVSFGVMRQFPKYSIQKHPSLVKRDCKSKVKWTKEQESKGLPSKSINRPPATQAPTKIGCHKSSVLHPNQLHFFRLYMLEVGHPNWSQLFPPESIQMTLRAST